MKRSSEEENKKPFATPLFSVKEPLQNPDSFNQLIGRKNKNMFSENNSVFFDTTDVFKNMTSKIDRLDASIYRNRLNNVIHPLSEKKSENLIQLTKNFIENKTKINQSTLETIFRPNKASQTVLSNTGSDIDITALILNIINPVPDPLIYLEEKGGLIRNYGVSVIIDPSFSCLFNLSEAHTLLTIRHILSSFAALDIPCFDLIVSGCPQPTVLCSEVRTLNALDQKSSI